MDRPVHSLMSVLAVIATCSIGFGADEDPKRRERTVSPRMAELLASAMPKFEPLPAVQPADVSSAPVTVEKPANGLVRLPSYVVREPKIPAPAEVMTQREREKFAMQKYLGAENGLERALNMLSMSGLWAKIPLLGKYPFIVGQFQGRHSGLAVGPMTNEQRALELYEKEQMKERWDQLSGLMSPQLKPAPPPPKE